MMVYVTEYNFQMMLQIPRGSRWAFMLTTILRDQGADLTRETAKKAKAIQLQQCGTCHSKGPVLLG